MQAQFEQLRRDLTEVIKNELRLSEERLSDQYKASVEEMRGQVRLAAEAFGGPLDLIRGDIRELKSTFEDTTKLHAQVLVTHSRDIVAQSREIEELKRRSGH